MSSNLFRWLGRLYSSLATLVVAALLGVATVAAWHFYQEEYMRSQLAAKGQPVTVQIESTDRRPRQVWDRLGNFVYVGFRYEGRPYEVRCAAPTRWLAAGDQLALLHLPGGGVFGPPRAAPPTRRHPGTSRLVDWSALPDFTPQTLALVLFGLAAGALFFVGSGLLASLTGWRIFSALARPVAVAVLGGLALYFTFDTAQYYRYAAALQRDGQPLTVAVARAEQHMYGRKLRVYTYTATFQFRNQERVVAIEEADYDRLLAGDRRLAVRYEPTRDDFIAVGYSLHWLPLLVPLFCWVMLVVVFRPDVARSTAATVPRL